MYGTFIFLQTYLFIRKNFLSNFQTKLSKDKKDSLSSQSSKKDDTKDKGDSAKTDVAPDKAKDHPFRDKSTRKVCSLTFEKNHYALIL